MPILNSKQTRSCLSNCKSSNKRSTLGRIATNLNSFNKRLSISSRNQCADGNSIEKKHASRTKCYPTSFKSKRTNFTQSKKTILLSKSSKKYGKSNKRWIRDFMKRLSNVNRKERRWKR